MRPVAIHLLETPGRAVCEHQHEVARPLGISVHDHVIVGKEGHASFKGIAVDLVQIPLPSVASPPRAK
jgi:hypothetical protein